MRQPYTRRTCPMSAFSLVCAGAADAGQGAWWDARVVAHLCRRVAYSCPHLMDIPRGLSPLSSTHPQANSLMIRQVMMIALHMPLCRVSRTAARSDESHNSRPPHQRICTLLPHHRPRPPRQSHGTHRHEAGRDKDVLDDAKATTAPLYACCQASPHHPWPAHILICPSPIPPPRHSSRHPPPAAAKPRHKDTTGS